MVVDQRVVKSSWATNTISTLDTLQQRHNKHNEPDPGSTLVRYKDAASNICYPMPITVKFVPKKNVKYTSRFRFICEYGNSFDLVLQGEGTYEEHEHHPLTPVPRE